jgi:hypothetical protein
MQTFGTFTLIKILDNILDVPKYIGDLVNAVE